MGDGGDLYSYIRKSGAKSWESRYIKPATGKVTFTGIGGFPDYSLAEAREKASEIRKLVAEGIDPQLLKAEQKAKTANKQVNTFKAVAELWMDTKLHRIKAKTIEGNWRKLALSPSTMKLCWSKWGILNFHPDVKIGHIQDG